MEQALIVICSATFILTLICAITSIAQWIVGIFKAKKALKNTNIDEQIKHYEDLKKQTSDTVQLAWLDDKINDLKSKTKSKK